MYKYFLRPMKIIFVVYFVGGLGIASDIAQLTSFNFLDFLERHSPQSVYLLIVVSLLLYFILVIIEFLKNPIKQPSELERNTGQSIRVGNVNNSNIIQIKKDKED